jgi:multidrug resistance protein, MATE family
LIPIGFINWYSGDFLLLMGQDAGIAEYSQIYSRWNLIGVPFVFLYELQRKALQAQGIMTPLVGIAVMGNVVQILAGYWLAYYTSWGFAGVALSRSLGNMALPLMLWLYFKHKPEHLSQWWSGWDLRAAAEHVGLFMRLGLPGMLMLVMEWWAFEIMSLMAGLLPDPVVAMSAHSVVLNIVSLLYIVFLGSSVAANIRVGNHLGAGLPMRAQAVRVLVTKLAVALGLALGLAAFFARHWIPLLFVNDPVAIESAARVLVFWTPFEISEGVNSVMQGIFRGSGMQDMAARINMVTFYLFGMPLAYVLAFRAHWSVDGLWFGMGLSLTLSAALLTHKSSRWDWRALADAAKRRTAE